MILESWTSDPWDPLVPWPRLCRNSAVHAWLKVELGDVTARYSLITKNTEWTRWKQHNINSPIDEYVRNVAEDMSQHFERTIPLHGIACRHGSWWWPLSPALFQCRCFRWTQTKPNLWVAYGRQNQTWLFRLHSDWHKLKPFLLCQKEHLAQIWVMHSHIYRVKYLKDLQNLPKFLPMYYPHETFK
jgi:hypothetical protein